MVKAKLITAVTGIISFLLLSARVCYGVSQPLGFIDFSTDESKYLTAESEMAEFTVLDGYRLLRLMRPTMSIPVEFSADMPDPGLPGVDNPARRPADVPLPFLSLRIDRGAAGLGDEPLDLVLVFTVYDITEHNRGNQSINVVWTQDGKQAAGRFQLSGNPYSPDRFNRPRFVRKMITARRVEAPGGQQEWDMRLEAPATLHLKKVEIYPVPPLPDNFRDLRRPEAVSSQPYAEPADISSHHRSVQANLPVYLFEINSWRQDGGVLYDRQAEIYARRTEVEDGARVLIRHAKSEGWRRMVRQAESMLDAIETKVEASLFAMDSFYYDGRYELVRRSVAGYDALAEEAVKSLSGITSELDRLESFAQNGFARLRRLPGRFKGEASGFAADNRFSMEELPVAEQPTPLERVFFMRFGGSDRMRSVGIEAERLGGWGAIALNPDGSVNEASVNHRISQIKESRSNGFNVVPWVGHHTKYLAHGGIPRWVQEKMGQQYDHAGLGDIWHPALQDYFGDVLENYARILAPNPGVLPWFCWSEIAGGNPYGRATAEAAFRGYLEQYYGDIKTLNDAWGSDYEGFVSITPPPDSGELLRREASGLTYHFEKFRRDSFTDWFRIARDALRRGNPEARLWLDGWGRLDYLLRHGMDQLGLYDIADIAAVHTGSVGQLFQHRWQSALARYSGTPSSDGEINISGTYYAGFATQEQLRAAAESHVLKQFYYGVRAFTFWGGQFDIWRSYAYGGPYLYDSDRESQFSPAGAALRVVRRKTDLYDPVIKNTRELNPGVGILYSSTSHIHSWPYNEAEHEIYPIHGWLYQSEAGYWMLHEDAIADGREDLARFKVIFTPWAAWLKTEVAEALLDWVQRGGVLISSGPVGAFDPYGRSLNTIQEALLGEVKVSYGQHERTGETRLCRQSVAYLNAIGDMHTGHFGGWTWNIEPAGTIPPEKVMLSLVDGTPVVYGGEVGSGRIILSSGPLGKNGLRRLAMQQVEQRVVPAVRYAAEDGLHVQARRDARDNLYLAVINQSVYRRVSDTLRAPGRYPSVTERTLWGDWTIPAEYTEGETLIPVSLAPGESTMLFLGSRLAANPPSADRGIDIVRDKDKEPPEWSGRDADAAAKIIRGRQQEARVKAEALALLAAARRHGAMGYLNRARRLTEQALAMRAYQEPFHYEQDVVKAVRARMPVSVDGNPEEWLEVKRYPVKGTADSGGEFAFQWDDENLYLLAVVQDADLRWEEEKGHSAALNWIWAYDGIELVINAANTAPLSIAGPLYDAKQHAGQSLIALSITGRKYVNGPAGFSPGSVKSAMREIPGGYVMEASVPLRDIMVPAIAGADMGFRFQITDNGRGRGFGFFSNRAGGLSSDGLIFNRLRFVEAP